MESYNKKWLPHLENAIPVEAQLNRISLYTIALEGWRRGLELKFSSFKVNHAIDIRCSLSDGIKTHYFESSGGDKNSAHAVDICDNKALAKEHLSASGVPVAPGRSFGRDASPEELLQYARTIGFPVVLKPVSDKGGKGVFVELQNENNLKEAFTKIKQLKNCQNILLEKFMEGEEVRIFVLDGKVLGSIKRVPANVVGDGKLSILKLIEEKNKGRKVSPHLKFRPIKVDDHVKTNLKEQGFTLESIPKSGERVLLRKTSNISTGGEPVEVTNELTAEQKTIAVQAVEAIPGLVHGGVDMLVTKDGGIILEINAKPGLGSHLFPVKGDSVDIPEKIIDFYFPETTKNARRTSNAYFDFNTVKYGLESGTLQEIEINPPPEGVLYAKVYEITGDIEPISFFPWLQRKVQEKQLHGFLERRGEKRMDIMIAGESEEQVDSFSEVLDHGSIRSLIIDVKKKDWNKPVKIGFSLIDGLQSLSVKELENKITEAGKRYQQVSKERERFKKQIKKVENSRMWKLTRVLRTMRKSGRG